MKIGQGGIYIRIQCHNNNFALPSQETHIYVVYILKKYVFFRAAETKFFIALLVELLLFRKQGLIALSLQLFWYHTTE